MLCKVQVYISALNRLLTFIKLSINDIFTRFYGLHNAIAMNQSFEGLDDKASKTFTGCSHLLPVLVVFFFGYSI